MLLAKPHTGSSRPRVHRIATKEFPLLRNVEKIDDAVTGERIRINVLGILSKPYKNPKHERTQEVIILRHSETRTSILPAKIILDKEFFFTTLDYGSAITQGAN